MTLKLCRNLLFYSFTKTNLELFASLQLCQTRNLEILAPTRHRLVSCIISFILFFPFLVIINYTPFRCNFINRKGFPIYVLTLFREKQTIKQGYRVHISLPLSLSMPQLDFNGENDQKTNNF